MQETIINLFESIGLSDMQGQIAETILLLLVLWLVRRLVVRIVAQRTSDPTVIYNWRKGIAYTTTLIGVLWILPIWLDGVSSAITYLGLLSAGLAIALQDPLKNLFGWMYIVSRRPFDVGDRIEVGSEAGDVIDIGLFHFTLLEIRNWVHADQSTGRILLVPNKNVFENATASYNKGFNYIWDEIDVEVTFESDWKKAKEILLKITKKHATDLSKDARQKLRKAAERYLIHYPNLTPIVYTRVAASGVQLSSRFLCEPRQRRGVEQAIWEDILETFAAHDDIDFAYPTQRIFYHPTEGKTLLLDHDKVAHPVRGDLLH